MIFLLSIGVVIYVSGCLNCFFNHNRNLIIFLIASEIMFLGLNMLFIGSSILMADYNFFIYGFIIIFSTISESVIGLGLCVLALRTKKTTIIREFTNKK
jgi:NADH:ubiquinone oxidoreductase subunit K